MEKYFSFKTKAISKSRNSSLLKLDDLLKQEYVYSSLQKDTHPKKKNTKVHATTPNGIFSSFKVTFPM